MIQLALLFLFIADEPFEEFLEHETVQEEILVPTFEDSLIAPQEDRDELIEYVKEGEDSHLYLSSSCPFEELLERVVKPGSCVVNVGAKEGISTLALSSLVGPEGEVHSFNFSPEVFRAQYWNLVHNGVSNAKLYCNILQEGGKTLDALELKNVSLLIIDAHGREDLFLKGAGATIRRERPVIILNMLGGISLEQTDLYVREKFHKRMENIRKYDYTMQRISSSYYLGLPN